MASQAFASGRSRSSMILSSSVGHDDGRVSSVKRISHYQVYRGMSPNSSNRLEIRIKELEDSLESEREARIRAEKDLSEATLQIDDLSERLEAAESLGSTQGELSRRREQEIQKLKKDLELLATQFEASDFTQKKRHQEALKDLNDHLDRFRLDKTKHDKERQQLLVEIDSLASSLDESNKAKAAVESRVEGLDGQLRRLQAHLDEVGRQGQEFNAVRTRLIHENQELNRHVQDLDASNGALSKTKHVLQQQLDEAKNGLDEETRVRSQLAIQLANLQVEFENLSVRLDEEMDASLELKNQLQRSQNEFQLLKSKYDKEISLMTEELEETRRKFTMRLAELEETVSQSQGRASKLEKEKTTLQIEIREILDENNKVKAAVAEMGKRLSQADHLSGEFRSRIDELTRELQGVTGDRQALLAEVPRLKAIADEAHKKLEVTLRENKQMSDVLRELRDENKALGRKVNELQELRTQLDSERNALVAELNEIQEAFKDAQGQLEAKNSTLNQIRTELEQRLREKDEEMESVRKSAQKAIEELQRSITEIEAKYRSENNRLKKKYESDIAEYDAQIENVTRSNSELNKTNKALANRLKELELALETERRNSEDAKQAVVIVERRRLQIQKDYEDMRSKADAADRAKKSADSELAETSIRMAELTSTVTTLSAERRRVETDAARTASDLDEATRARRELEELADRLKSELNRLTEELRNEQERAGRAEEERRQMEAGMRQLATQMQELETQAHKEGKRLVAKLQARLHEVEFELDAEQRRGRDCLAENKKVQRLLQEQRTQFEDLQRTNAQLIDQVNALQIKLKTTIRQLSEAEEVVAITMNRYRKANQILEEYERQTEVKGQVLSRSSVVYSGGLTVGGLGLPDSRRSMSTTREVTRVVRL